MVFLWHVRHLVHDQMGLGDKGTIFYIYNYNFLHFYWAETSLCYCANYTNGILYTFTHFCPRILGEYIYLYSRAILECLFLRQVFGVFGAPHSLHS